MNRKEFASQTAFQTNYNHLVHGNFAHVLRGETNVLSFWMQSAIMRFYLLLGCVNTSAKARISEKRKTNTSHIREEKSLWKSM